MAKCCRMPVKRCIGGGRTGMSDYSFTAPVIPET
jgi:hypothetical protein